MTDALQDREGTVNIGDKTITNLRFAEDIDGLAGERRERRTDKISRASGKKSRHSLRPGGQCQEDQVDDKQTASVASTKRLK